ncbi:MAG: hypothetical protein Q8L73_09790 [Methylotenera sp.]|nr:hypothetical protein [Methylotenera sp.]
MNTFKYKTLAALLSTTLLLTGTISAYAADYAGSYKGTITKQDGLPIVDNGQHVIALGTSTGTNKSTGKKDYFDGGMVVVTDFIDIVNGNGTHQGYWTVSKDGEQVTNSLKGKMVTVMAADGKTPMTTIEGTVDGLYGTNFYGTIHPVGVYKVTFTSPTEYLCEWSVTGFK